jgi:hypothetical protein
MVITLQQTFLLTLLGIVVGIFDSYVRYRWWELSERRHFLAYLAMALVAASVLLVAGGDRFDDAAGWAKLYRAWWIVAGIGSCFVRMLPYRPSGGAG